MLVSLVATAAADQRIAWDTLTDYGCLRAFVPDLETGGKR